MNKQFVAVETRAHIPITAVSLVAVPKAFLREAFRFPLLSRLRTSVDISSEAIRLKVLFEQHTWLFQKIKKPKGNRCGCFWNTATYD